MAAITQVRNSLWTADGEVPLTQKDVIPVTREDIILLSKLHEFAFKHQINIFCKRCSKAIQGQNNDSSKLLAVACQCREWVFDGR